MSDFKVGDFVKIYGTVPCEVNPLSKAYKRGERGIITEMIHTDEVTVKTKFGHTQAHPKQLRKLKPKREPRRIWLNIYPGYIGGLSEKREFAEKSVLPGGVVTEFQEVLPKRKKNE